MWSSSQETTCEYLLLQPPCDRTACCAVLCWEEGLLADRRGVNAQQWQHLWQPAYEQGARGKLQEQQAMDRAWCVTRQT